MKKLDYWSVNVHYSTFCEVPPEVQIRVRRLKILQNAQKG